jgi:hypothetical protein
VIYNIPLVRCLFYWSLMNNLTCFLAAGL